MTDVLVIGAGIVGCACAYELAKAGARVTVVEYGRAGMQATNAAAGILAPYSEAESPSEMMRFRTRGLREYPALVAELEERCGFGVEFQQRGLLRLAFDDGEADGLRRRWAWQREMGIAAEWLDATAVHELEPRVSDRALAGVFWPDEAWVSNQLMALALQRAAVGLGVAVREGAPVTHIWRKGERVGAIEAGSETHECDTVVLAAGARSGQIAAKVGATLPVMPVRGQMLALGGMQAPISHVVSSDAGYLVPRANGLIFAGATVEHVGFRRRTTKDGMRRMRSMASRLVPQLAAAEVQFEWAGLRPGTPDGLPIIGPVPGLRNLVAATGHYRSGILLGPLTGKLIAKGICNGDWSEVPEEFSPARFGA
jgi:glycine oxidase